MRAAVCGSKRKDQALWCSVVAISDAQAAWSFSEKLCNLLSLPKKDANADPALHWVHCLYYLYRLAISDSKIRLMEVAHMIENLVSTG